MTYDGITTCLDTLAGELQRYQGELDTFKATLLKAQRDVESAKLSVEALSKPVGLRNFSTPGLIGELYEREFGKNGKA